MKILVKKWIFFCLLCLLASEVVIRGAPMDPYYQDRLKMVEKQIAARGVCNVRVLDAMKKVPRHLFVPEAYQRFAYRDEPLPIGQGQTISQPYIVAYMTEVVDVQPSDRVLEIGTGSGYQVLAEIADSVFTIEIIESLGKQAHAVLDQLEYQNIMFRIGDGYHGWQEKVPFDCIIVTAAPPEIPQLLIDQLKIGGRMIVPVGVHHQELLLIEKTRTGTIMKHLLPVRFVPMTSDVQ